MLSGPRPPTLIALFVIVVVGLAGVAEGAADEGEKPEAVIHAECQDLQCEFNASPSTPSDSPIHSFEWEFGDETEGSGEAVTHEYQAYGAYNVILTVQDEEGTTATDTIRAYVGDPPPIPPTSPTASLHVDCEGLSCTFDASESYNKDGIIQTHGWEFNWEPGTEQFREPPSPNKKYDALGETVPHEYEEPGVYTVQLSVYEPGNPKPGVALEEDLFVHDPDEPLAHFTYECDGKICTFDASPSKSGATPLEAYHWDLGDGMSAAGQQLVHAYQERGEYPVTLTVTNGDGSEHSAIERLFAADLPEPSPYHVPGSPGPNGDVEADTQEGIVQQGEPRLAPIPTWGAIAVFLATLAAIWKIE